MNMSATTRSMRLPGRETIRRMCRACCRAAACCRYVTTRMGTPSAALSKLRASSMMDGRRFSWYWGQEWVKYRFYDSAQWTVPTALMRQGDFSELLTNTPVNILGKVVPLVDPNTKVPIPGNIIPSSLLSQNGLGILKAYPKP